MRKERKNLLLAYRQFRLWQLAYIRTLNMKLKNMVAMGGIEPPTSAVGWVAIS
jgi:hypothetical protein